MSRLSLLAPTRNQSLELVEDLGIAPRDRVDEKRHERLERRVGGDEGAERPSCNVRHEIGATPSMPVGEGPALLFSIEHTLTMQAIEGRHEGGIRGERKPRLQIAYRCRPANCPQRIKDARFERAEHSREVYARGVEHPVIIGSFVHAKRTARHQHLIS